MERDPEAHWEREAASWIAWARTPGHDAYWDYADRFFDEVVPPAGRRTLDVGAGEGRVARDLARRGHRVVAVERSPTLVRAAAAADPAGAYLLGDALRLPFDDGAFDAVVAYNSLMDVRDMPAAVREAARVLAPGGRLCVCVTHPFNDAGRFPSDDPDAPFVVEGSYLDRSWFEGRFERDGLTMTFAGWNHPLEDYARALESAGLRIELLREPKASAGAVAADPAKHRWRRVPMFLFLRAVGG